MQSFEIVVAPENAKMRLDVFLENSNPTFSRSHYKNSIVNGDVLVNGKQVKAGYSLKVGDIVLATVAPPKELDVAPQDIDLDIVYEDNDFAVINKPQGMVVHPAVGNYDGTLVNALLFNIKNLSGINGVIRPGIVHRLDKDTSGLIIVAKNDVSHVSLSKQIANKTCKRFYYALVEGNVKSDNGIITTNIGRDKKNRLKMAVVEEGKFAETHYKVIRQYDGYTLLECELKTGRTHQIRVHAKHIGHPIVGDMLYNTIKQKFNLDGQLLHAIRLQVNHPTTKEDMVFESKLPSYFEEVLNKLDKS